MQKNVLSKYLFYVVKQTIERPNTVFDTQMIFKQSKSDMSLLFFPMFSSCCILAFKVLQEHNFV